MSFEANVRKIPGLLAGQDFSGANTGKYRFGLIGEQRLVTICAAAGSRPDGVIMDNPAINTRVEFGVGDVVQVVAGGPVTCGDLAAVGDGGTVVRQASTACVVGKILDDGTAADVVSVLIQLQGAP